MCVVIAYRNVGANLEMLKNAYAVRSRARSDNPCGEPALAKIRPHGIDAVVGFKGRNHCVHGRPLSTSTQRERNLRVDERLIEIEKDELAHGISVRKNIKLLPGGRGAPFCSIYRSANFANKIFDFLRVAQGQGSLGLHE